MSLSVVPRKADRRTEVDDLRMEVHALLAERTTFGHELAWLSRVIIRAVLQERTDLFMEVSGRLDDLADRFIRQSGNTEGTAA